MGMLNVLDNALLSVPISFGAQGRLLRRGRLGSTVHRDSDLLPVIKVSIQTFPNSSRDHQLIQLGPGKVIKNLGGVYRIPCRGLYPQMVVNRASQGDCQESQDQG